MNDRSRWDSSRAGSYDTHWQKMADAGINPHGEVDFVQRYAPTSVLDAGCGTGRVAIELAARGVQAMGSDIDARWVESDLASLQLGEQFDVVVMAGNIILFVAPGTEAAVVAGAARHVAPGGRLIAGFSLRGVTADDWEGWTRDAGLEPEERFSTWGSDPWTPGDDYLVSVASRPI